MLELRKKWIKYFLRRENFLFVGLEMQQIWKEELMTCIRLNFVQYEGGLDSRSGTVQNLRHPLQLTQTSRIWIDAARNIPSVFGFI
jgi:hypothetical protein